MDNVEAINIIEGVEEADADTKREAWQHLLDTGVVWSLQGSYGRHAMRLIKQGLITVPDEEVNPL